MPHYGTPINPKIGQRVMLARKKKKWTQQYLAREAKTSFAVISRLETGTQSVSAERLAIIARVLGVSLDYLCREENGLSELLTTREVLAGH